MSETVMQQARDEEDKVLSVAVKAALHTFIEICQNESLAEEVRIDAASRILGYAATFQPEINITTDVGGDDDGDDDTTESDE